jgi:hypothetical protein
MKLELNTEELTKEQRIALIECGLKGKKLNEAIDKWKYETS